LARFFLASARPALAACVMRGAHTAASLCIVVAISSVRAACSESCSRRAYRCNHSLTHTASMRIAYTLARPGRAPKQHAAASQTVPERQDRARKSGGMAKQHRDGRAIQCWFKRDWGRVWQPGSA
jgi:hypothetical protein